MTCAPTPYRHCEAARSAAASAARKRRLTAASLRAPEGREAIQGLLPVAPGSRRRPRLLAMTVGRGTFLPGVPGRSVTAPRDEQIAMTGSGRGCSQLRQIEPEDPKPEGG